MTVDALQLERFDVRDGDLFVIRCDHVITFETMERLKRTWEEHWPSTKAMVLGPGMSIERICTMPRMVADDLGLVDDQ